MNCRLAASSLKISLLFGVLGTFPALATTLPPDSTGVERRDGSVFVLHRVDRGQTLYSILKRYGALFADYKTANPGAPDAVHPDQVLRVPYNRSRAMNPEQSAVPELAKAAPPRPQNPPPTETASSETRPPERPRPTPANPPATSTGTAPTGTGVRPTPTANRPGTHEVQPGETLYSIARRYGLAVDDVKRWNNLPDAGGVQLGQVLLLSGDVLPKKPTKTAAEIAREQLKTPPVEPKPEPKAVPPPAPRSESARPVETASKRPAEPEEPANAEAESPAERPVRVAAPSAAPAAKNRRETGLAEVISVDDKSGRYLGLHRTAPVGTMVTVRNEANSQVVMVKIIGKLPDTGLNDRVIIKLSPGAFSRLSPVDRRFRAEVSFVMP